jgi:hypothetical protein
MDDLNVEILNYHIYNKFSLHDEVEINKSDPDYHIENFWYGFKMSMINFYNQNKLSYNHIYQWSSNLNKLKTEKKYNEIEYLIREYISIYSKDIIINSIDISYYDDDILITNIKRWNKISQNYNFEKSTKHNNLLLIFLVFLEIKKCKKHIDANIIFIENFNKNYTIDKIVNDKNYDDFIIYALQYNKSKILELLQFINNYNLFNRILILFPKMRLYNNTNGMTKMNKICKLYKKLYD